MHASGDDTGQISLDVARRVVRQYLSRHPQMAWQRDELLSDAMLGATQARIRFEPARGVPFAVYCAQRARGALLDGLRDRGPMTRSEWRAAEGDMPEEYRPVSLNRIREGTRHGLPRAGLEREWEPAAREAGYDAVDARDSILRLLRVLSPRERYIVTAVFLSDRPQTSLALELGLTESRICQILKAALARARVDPAA